MTSGHPANYTILTDATDLENTTPGFWHGNQRNQVLNDSSCGPIKERGARISTLSLEYVVSPSAGGHERRIERELIPHLPDRMQRCASSGRLAYLANDPAEIQRAIDSMFHDAVEQARLTH